MENLGACTRKQCPIKQPAKYAPYVAVMDRRGRLYLCSKYPINPTCGFFVTHALPKATVLCLPAAVKASLTTERDVHEEDVCMPAKAGANKGGKTEKIVKPARGQLVSSKS